MDHAAIVGGRETAGDLPRVVGGFAGRQRPAGHPLVERFSIEDLGDDVRGAGLDADVVDREYVRMIQPAGSSRFLLESAPAIRIVGKCRRQDFDRDVAVQLMIACPIHLAHAPGAQ